jgi:hypothetical protein
MLFLFGVFLLLPVGSGVDVSNEIEWTIWRTNTCPLMNKSRRRTLDIYFIWLSTNKASSPSSEPMVLKYFKLTVSYHTVQLSFIDR